MKKNLLRGVWLLVLVSVGSWRSTYAMLRRCAAIAGRAVSARGLGMVQLPVTSVVQQVPRWTGDVYKDDTRGFRGFVAPHLYSPIPLYQIQASARQFLAGHAEALGNPVELNRIIVLFQNCQNLFYGGLGGNGELREKALIFLANGGMKIDDNVCCEVFGINLAHHITTLLKVKMILDKGSETGLSHDQKVLIVLLEAGAFCSECLEILEGAGSGSADDDINLGEEDLLK